MESLNKLLKSPYKIEFCRFDFSGEEEQESFIKHGMGYANNIELEGQEEKIKFLELAREIITKRIEKINEQIRNTVIKGDELC